MDIQRFVDILSEQEFLDLYEAVQRRVERQFLSRTRTALPPQAAAEEPEGEEEEEAAARTSQEALPPRQTNGKQTYRELFEEERPTILQVIMEAGHEGAGASDIAEALDITGDEKKKRQLSNYLRYLRDERNEIQNKGERRGSRWFLTGNGKRRARTARA